MPRYSLDFQSLLLGNPKERRGKGRGGQGEGKSREDGREERGGEERGREQRMVGRAIINLDKRLEEKVSDRKRKHDALELKTAFFITIVRRELGRQSHSPRHSLRCHSGRVALLCEGHREEGGVSLGSALPMTTFPNGWEVSWPALQV